jgi:hypothetical protein
VLKPTPHETALADALRPWVVRSTSLIANRLRDARAHAEAGRLADATARLDELALSLSEDILEPAREAFYRESFRTHRLELDPSVVDPDVVADRAGAFAARRAPILSRDQHADVRTLLATAGGELALANGIYAGHYSAYHQGWEVRHRDRITSHVEGALSNAQVALHNAIMVLMIKPELR